MAAQKAATEQKAEEDRKEAKKLFERAVELEKEGKLEDARVNTENAIALELTNREYKQFLDDLKDKIKNLNDKNELYKKYLSNADKLLKDGELEKALEEYEAAKFVFDNAEIIAKIIEVKRLIKNSETRKKQIEQLVSEASTLVQNTKFDTAKDKIDAILAIDSSNAEAKKLQTKIDETLQEIENHYKALIKEADISLRELRFESAIKKYNEALRIKSDDGYCLMQLKVVADKKESLKPTPPPPGKATKTDNTGFTPPPPIPTKDKPLSNGLPFKKGVPPPPPSIAPKSVNNGKIPPPPPPVPKKK
jgi:tetratricopeptide (TPR) repeat protein